MPSQMRSGTTAEQGEEPSLQLALLAAAIEAYDEKLALERKRFYATALRGRPLVELEVARTIELELSGHRHEVGVYCLEPGRYRTEAEGRWSELTLERLGPSERRLEIGDESHDVSIVAEGSGYRVEIGGVSYVVGLDAGVVVSSPSPAIVVSVAVSTGDRVELGDRLVVLEAMKMEMIVPTRFAGRVREVAVSPNVQVAPGARLLTIEPDTEVATRVGRPLDFSALPTIELAEEPRALCEQTSADLRSLLLGYDVGPGHQRWLMEARARLCRELPWDDEPLLCLEDELLELFADLTALFDPQSEVARWREAEPEAQDLPSGGLAGSGRLSASTYLHAYLRDLDAENERLPPDFVDRLGRALRHYGVAELDRGPELEEAIFRLYRSHRRIEDQVTPILDILERRLEAHDALADRLDGDFRDVLDRLAAEARGRFPALRDSAREVRYRYFDHRPWLERCERDYAHAGAQLDRLSQDPPAGERLQLVAELTECPQPLKSFLSARFDEASPELRGAMLEVLTRRYYRIRELEDLHVETLGEWPMVRARYPHGGGRIELLAVHARYGDLASALEALRPAVAECPVETDVTVDVYMWRSEPLEDADTTRDQILERLGRVDLGREIRRLVVALSAPGTGLGMGDVQHFTFRQHHPYAEPQPAGDAQVLAPDPAEMKTDGTFWEESLYRGLHPMMGKRLHLWRLRNFDLRRALPSPEDVYLFHGTARDNPRDERLFALAEVRDLRVSRGDDGRLISVPHLEHMYRAALAGIRRVQARLGERQRLHWNRVLLYLWPLLELETQELTELARRLFTEAEGLGIEKIVLSARWHRPEDGQVSEVVLHLESPEGGEPTVRFREPTAEPIAPLSDYDQKVLRLKRRGLVYPYELLEMVAPPRDVAQSRFPPGEWQEYDLDDENRLVPVERPPGENTANVVVAVVCNDTAKVPEGMTRVAVLGDPGNAMGSLAEPECRRILAALDLAREMGVPLEWYAVSAGAKIAMDSGTENMDWIALVLRRLIEFTQAGGEVNVLVLGINVGAQPYWNAEATMLMHTRGILVMIPQGAMVLTGKDALDYSGGVSADDNQGIGGYEQIMGPNGQAQYFARDVGEACEILLRHYDHTYVVPGERFPRHAPSSDPAERDVCEFPHGQQNGITFKTLGEVFSSETNPGRKKPFDIRRVMAAAIDQDHEHLERWGGMRDAEIAVVWDAHLGGYPVCLLGLESRPLPRLGFIPADGPEKWTAGTLFPQSSKKVARAINAASGNRPVVVLANLSGFDGSPESMRSWQLEYGAEIGRAVVNFRGPIVFCVVSRYHGGAFVVFSNALNENMEIAALEGTYASVIGGAPAAAVVFARDVEKRTRADARLEELDHQIQASKGAGRVQLQTRWREVYKTVRSEKLGEVADEFDHIHSVHRAQEVGSVHHIIPPERLRPYLIEALERGMAKTAD